MRSIGSTAVLVCAIAALTGCSGGGGGGDPNSPFRTISVTVLPPGSGSIVGDGRHNHGTEAELEATANGDYVFGFWGSITGGISPGQTLVDIETTEISDQPEHSFVVTEDRDLLARFYAQTELLVAPRTSTLPPPDLGPSYEGLPQTNSGIPDLGTPYSSLQIVPGESTPEIILRNFRQGDPDDEATWLKVCEYRGALNGIRLPAEVEASGTIHCAGNLDQVGTWTSEHIAKTDSDTYIMEIEAVPDQYSVKYSGFMLTPEHNVPERYRRAPLWSLEGVTVDNVEGSYHGYLKIGACAPPAPDILLPATTQIDVTGEGHIEIDFLETGETAGLACAFTGVIDDVNTHPLLVRAGTYDCDIGGTLSTGTWASPRIALTSPARDSILVDLTVTPEGGCTSRIRSIGFE